MTHKDQFYKMIFDVSIRQSCIALSNHFWNVLELLKKMHIEKQFNAFA